MTVTAERWQRMENVYHAALQRDAKDRLRFVALWPIHRKESFCKLLCQARSVVSVNAGLRDQEKSVWT
jgi:hypothetical protein